jgi:hypothetical protein
MYYESIEQLRSTRKELDNILNREGKLEDAILLSSKHFSFNDRLFKLSEETAECAAAISRFLAKDFDYSLGSPKEFSDMIGEIVDCHIVTTEILTNHVLGHYALLDGMFRVKLAKFQVALDKLERGSSGEN